MFGITPLILPRGFLTSPLYLGMMWIWKCMIVCPAVSPQLKPILYPSGWNFSSNIFFTFLIAKSIVLMWESGKSKYVSKCSFGIKSVCHFETGCSSKNAIRSEVSNKLLFLFIYFIAKYAHCICKYLNIFLIYLWFFSHLFAKGQDAVILNHCDLI